jgi:hypothetical protein
MSYEQPMSEGHSALAEHSRRMLKKAVQQGRSERRGEGVRFGTLSF